MSGQKPAAFIRPGNWVRVAGKSRKYLIREWPVPGAGGRWIVQVSKARGANALREHMFCDQLKPVGKDQHSEQTSHTVFRAWWRQQRQAAGLPLDCPECGSVLAEAHNVPWAVPAERWQVVCNGDCGRHKAAASKKLAIAVWNTSAGRDAADQALLELAVTAGYDLDSFGKDFR